MTVISIKKKCGGYCISGKKAIPGLKKIQDNTDTMASEIKRQASLLKILDPSSQNEGTSRCIFPSPPGKNRSGRCLCERHAETIRKGRDLKAGFPEQYSNYREWHSWPTGAPNNEQTFLPNFGLN